MTCPTCGSENRPGRKFCGQCGTGLDRACPSCGTPNEAEARFCGDCGAAIDEAPTPARTASPARSGEPGPGERSVQVAERRIVSVLFADLVGFTTLAEDRDPETVRDLLARYFESTRDVVERHGGVIEKFIGDAVMAVWGTPVAHEDDAERAVRTALEILDVVRGLELGLQARAGVVTGDAAVTVGATNQGMVAGDLVNTAARLQGVAEPGTVLVGEATMHAAGGAVAFEPVGEHALKGKVTPVPAWRALRVVAARGGQGRADGLEAPFVGRDEELRVLKDLLHATSRDPRLRLASISGPPGIGKSRLVWELEKYVDGVSEPIYWHRGRSPSYGEGVTFWALGEMVRRRAELVEDDDDTTTRERIAATVADYVPDAADRPDVERGLLALLGLEPAPSAGREALFPAWRAFFEAVAGRGTTVMVFEDLHWADAGLLDFVDHLLDWARALPILVVTVARPELFDRRPEWGAGRRHLVSIPLAPLPEPEMQSLLDGLVPGLPPAAAEAIVARSEGVPLYAVETVRALLAEGRIARDGDAVRPIGDLGDLRVPESLRSLIASRLDALDPDDRSLVQDASVLGQVFPAEALAAVSGVTAEDLQSKLRAFVRLELLEVETDPRSPERGQYRFVQSLIREVAYGMLGRRERRARHLAVARHLEAGGDEELAGALASHYLAAHEASEGEEADAVAVQARVTLTAAARRAADLGAPEQAVAYLDQALGVTSGSRERAELLLLAATVGAVAALPAAERFARDAVEAARAVGEIRGIGAALTMLGKVLLDASDVEPAVAILEEVADELAAAEDPPGHAQVLATLSRGYMRATQIDRAIETADRALAIAEPLGLEVVIAEALTNKGSSLTFRGRWREGSSLMATAAELAHELGQPTIELRARHNLAIAVVGDEPLVTERQLDAAIALARKIGDRAMHAWMIGTLGWVALSIGRRWDELTAAIEELLTETKLHGDRIRLAAVASGFLSARREGFDAYEQELRTALRDSAVAEERQMAGAALGQVALASGRLEEAYRLGLDAAREPAQAADYAARVAMRPAIWLRDAEMVRTAYQSGEVMYEPSHYNAALARLADGVEAAFTGRPDEARRLLVGVIHEMRELAFEADAACMTVDALVALPDDPDLRVLAGAARDTLERLRARVYLDKLDEILASPSVDSTVGGVATQRG